ncbi:type II toxin-antitoxin system VapC family toxin [Mitsuaria sp. TWR114]|uniref:type II toxin-antitoxin system VapC family toxin n=1 Tax=Mitsuaria sp. TWR114 TaxID=2601731 RepID=UPI00164C5003|nr:type II toxin-antitoxin system VapC family toxin [Mitsuaria sp. TWR114]
MDRVEPLYMLDTNILSYMMDPQARVQRVYCEERFAALRGRIAISVIVQAEVFAGLEKNPSPGKELRLRELMRRIRVEYLGPGLWFSDLFACIKASLERRGCPRSSSTWRSPRTRWRSVRPW